MAPHNDEEDLAAYRERRRNKIWKLGDAFKLMRADFAAAGTTAENRRSYSDPGYALKQTYTSLVSDLKGILASDHATPAKRIRDLGNDIKKDLALAKDELLVAGAGDLVFQELLPQHCEVLALKYSSPHGVIDKDVESLLKDCQALHLLDPRGEKAIEDVQNEENDPSTPRPKKDATPPAIKPEPVVDECDPDAGVDARLTNPRGEIEDPVAARHEACDGASNAAPASGEADDELSGAGETVAEAAEAAEAQEDSKTRRSPGSKRGRSCTLAGSDEEEPAKRQRVIDSEDIDKDGDEN